MKKELFLLMDRFGISKEKAEELVSSGRYGIFVSPTFDHSEPPNEIHLHHQLLKDFDLDSEERVATATEVIKYELKDGNFKIHSTHFKQP